jgi:maltokinase
MIGDLTALAALIREWLPQQRWFGGHGRDITDVEVREFARIEETHLVIARAHYADGHSDLYQLPLVLHEHPSSQLEYVQLGTIDTDDGPRWLYDALHDKDATGAWLAMLRESAEVGPLRFHRLAPAEDIPVGTTSLPLNAEQSNTSLIFDDAAIFKVFRRLQPGFNPDIESLEAITARGGAHVARLFGYVTAYLDGEDGEPYALASLQEYLTTATDGWDLARASLRDLLADTAVAPEEAGGDFAGEAERLGEAVASVHADLAAAFGSRLATREEIDARARAMHARLDAAIEIVAELAPLADGIRQRYNELAEMTESVSVQRIHGDLHLGQTLRTTRRWVIIDFEGEPNEDLVRRRAYRTPLQDVAGMLRSFDYAAQHRVLELMQEQNLSDLARQRAMEWTQRNGAAFLDGYTHASGHDPREMPLALRALIADKAVYEAVYESRFRPSWLPVPIASLTALAQNGGI